MFTVSNKAADFGANKVKKKFTMLAHVAIYKIKGKRIQNSYKKLKLG